MARIPDDYYVTCAIKCQRDTPRTQVIAPPPLAESPPPSTLAPPPRPCASTPVLRIFGLCSLLPVRLWRSLDYLNEAWFAILPR